MSNVIVGSSEQELKLRESFYSQFLQCPISGMELLQNLGLFINRQSLSRILFLDELYRKIVNVHGVVMDFGTRWGQNMALFSNFRGMYEPFNYSRKIIGFDTFAGFPVISQQDGKQVHPGDYSVTQNYEEYLDRVLAYHEQESPIPHIKKYEIIKGVIALTLKTYLEKNPETIIAFAYFDFDLYAPTWSALRMIAPHVTRGTVLAFDELSCKEFPGETLALREILGTDKYKIRRSENSSTASYIVIGE